MENRRIVKFILVFSAIFLFIPVFSFAYNDTHTHPAITDEIIDLFNYYYPNLKILDQGKEIIKKGSTDEDVPPRWMQHFYDPVYNQGLVLGITYEKSKDWAQDTVAQTGVSQDSLASLAINYFSYPDDYSWDRAVYEYVWGNKNRALEALGHTLHLLEDATVPEHTRNDVHLPFFDWGSPYEDWTKQFNDQNFFVADKLEKEGKNPIILSDLNQYFDNNAVYSNNNFFSKDTIFLDKYTLPIPTGGEKKIDKTVFIYTKDNDKNEILLARKYKILNPITLEFTDSYSIKDDRYLVLNNYWSFLSERAVLNGAGVIKLFFDAVEKEKNSKVLLNKNTSFLGKIIAAIGNLFSGGEETVPAVVYQTPPPEPTPGVGETSVSSPLPSEPSPTSQIPPTQGVSESTTVVDSAPAVVTTPPVKPPTTVVGSTLPYPGFGGGSGAPIPLSSVQQESSLSSPPDITPPNPPLIIFPTDFSQTFTSTEITFTGTAEASSTISSDFNSSTTTANSIGNWSLQFSFGQGTTTIKFYATDSAGNISSSTEINLIIDSQAPDVSFSISECQNSLASDGCLLATTTLNILWSSTATDLDYFELNFAGNVSTTTATSTIISVLDNSTNNFAVRAKDTAGNWSAPTTKSVEVSSMPVVINEVAWSGTTASPHDEWIELHNRTNYDINLNGWVLYSQTDNTPYINLSGSILSKGYYLLERTNDNTVSDILADQIYTGGLENSGENLILSCVSTTIDQTPSGGWPGGLGNPFYLSMERYDFDTPGSDTTNWGNNIYTAIIRNGKNADGQPVNGTPKARNSLNYLIAKGTSSIFDNIILKKSNSPYLVNNQIQVFQNNATLSIEPGVTINFYNDAGMTFVQNSKLLAQGTQTDPITFASFDSQYWYGVEIQTTNSDSVIDYANFKQGGKWYNGVGNHMANLSVKDTSVKITNSIFENSKVYGLKLSNSNSAVSNNIFQNNNQDFDPAGYDGGVLVLGGNPTIQNNRFLNNHRGIYSYSPQSQISSNVFNSNLSKAIYSSGPPAAFTNNSGAGNGTNGIYLSGGDIVQPNTSITLKPNGLPYVFDGTLNIPAGASLAIEPNVMMKGEGGYWGGRMNIFGNLFVNGANSSDIIFTANADNPAKGYWRGVFAYPGSFTDIRGATFSYADTAISYQGPAIKLENVKFENNNLAIRADEASATQTITAILIEFLNNLATTSPSLW